MKTHWSWSLIVLLGAGLVLFGCSGDGNGQEQPIEDLMPAGGEVSGWDEDTSMGAPGVESAHTQAEGEELINGALDPFTDTGKWVAMAIEYYVNGDMTAELQMHEMEDAASCEGIYTYLEGHPEGTPWEQEGPGVGEASRWADQGPYWLIHVRKGKYFFSINFAPGDDASKTPATGFATAVAAGLP